MIMSSCIDISVSRVGEGMSLNIDRIPRSIELGASRVGLPIEIRCGLVCSIASDFYLKVPQESIWLLPDNDFSQDVVVYANVSWTIE